jgi:hypothetical protein
LRWGLSFFLFFVSPYWPWTTILQISLSLVARLTGPQASFCLQSLLTFSGWDRVGIPTLP